MFPPRQKRNRFLASLGLQLKKARPWHTPTHVFLEVTNHCNLSCVMCGRTHDPRHGDESFLGHMSLETVRALDEFYPASSVVTATGLGEPFLNPDFLAIVSHLKRRGAEVSFTSNGTLLDGTAARGVLDAGADRIVFSIDSPDPKTFEQIRIGATLEPIVANLERLTALRAARPQRLPYLILEIVAMARNFHQLPEFADLAVRLDFDEVIVQNLFKHFAPGYDSFYRKNSLSTLEPREAREIWKRFEGKLAAAGVGLYSPFQGGGLEAYLAAGRQSGEPGLKRRRGFVGYIDTPEPMARIGDQLEVAGWALSADGFPDAELRLESHVGTLQKRVRATVDRPDVPPHLPDGYRPLSMCGFRDRLDVAGLEPGVYGLSLRVWSEGKGTTLARQQVVLQGPSTHAMYCSQPWSTLFVTWKGEVRSCCFNEYVVGDLRRDSARSVWRGPGFFDLRRRVAAGDVLTECADCLAGKSNPDYIQPLSRLWR